MLQGKNVNKNDFIGNNVKVRKRSSFEVKTRNLQGMLFELNEILPRSIAVRDEVVDRLRPIANQISEKVIAAWDDYNNCVSLNSDANRDKKWKTLTYNVKLSNRLAEIPGFVIRNDFEETNLLDYGEYLIWVKKLDKKSRPIINNTKASKLRINQETDSNDLSPVLIMGFQFAKDGTVDNLSFSYFKGKDVLWRIFLDELLANAVLPKESSLQIVSSGDEDFIKVKSDAQKINTGEIAINE